MDIQIQIAIFQFLSTIVGVVVGAIISFFVTNRQASSNLKLKKVDILQGHISKIENVIYQMGQARIDVSEKNISDDLMSSKIFDNFSSHSALFLHISYMFPKELEKKIKTMQLQLGNCISRAKRNEKQDETEARLVHSGVGPLKKEFHTAMSDKLRELQIELLELCKSS